MAGLREGGNEPAGSLKAICNLIYETPAPDQETFLSRILAAFDEVREMLDVFGRVRQNFLRLSYACIECGNVCKMIDNDDSFRQRAVIEFLIKEKKSSAEIHLRHQHAYGDVCIGASNVRRWMKHFKYGNKSTQDESRRGSASNCLRGTQQGKS
ncbi:hypothetical protein ANN_06741 [Periplaneta americana]|uniref:Uncharacterized protein n=1 Tax=Periplaneta americana TaxID=6978 RepID=A0ABQ8TF42_PERAM|nr:hypothetical protein ANN_06741 [Periplaneta americana]